MKFRLRTLLLIFALASISFAVGKSLISFNGMSGRNTSVQWANAWLWQEARLPEAASDVTFFVDFGACEAEFAISERPFLAWCEAHGWEVESIDEPVAYFDPMWLAPDTRPVDRGIHFSPPSGRGVYDATRSRAAYWISTFP